MVRVVSLDGRTWRLAFVAVVVAALGWACSTFKNGGSGGAGEGGGGAGDGAAGDDGSSQAGDSGADGHAPGGDSGGGGTDAPSGDSPSGGDGGCGLTCGTNTGVLLHGGWENHALGETWTFDGIAWSEHDGGTSPGARFGAATAPLHEAVVLFGGQDESSTDHGDTWVWNGSGWAMAADAGPPPRENAVATTLGSNVVLFGGEDSQGRFGDTWAWNGSAWSQRASVGPSGRRGAAMATLGNQVVLFGGEDD
ncbi:MAG TPA: kelch repeat-containing protein, partial [Polyangiaceae bacterium]